MNDSRILALIMTATLIATWCVIFFVDMPRDDEAKDKIHKYEEILYENDLLKRCVNVKEKTFKYVEMNEGCE